MGCLAGVSRSCGRLCGGSSGSSKRSLAKKERPPSDNTAAIGPSWGDGVEVPLELADGPGINAQPTHPAVRLQLEQQCQRELAAAGAASGACPSADAAPEGNGEVSPTRSPDAVGALELEPENVVSVDGPAVVDAGLVDERAPENALQDRGVWEEPVAFFTGWWAGTRNDWRGDVGISFLTETRCKVTALGRRAPDGSLASATWVTLWSEETESEVARVEVGPASPVEDGYAFEELKTPIVLPAGMEYRLSQRCWQGMPDPWFDGKASLHEATVHSAVHHARFISGVCRNSAGYPQRRDGELRRAGVVNMKIARKGVQVVPVTKDALAFVLARIAAAEEAGNSEAENVYISVLASVLGLLVDELQEYPKVDAMIVVAPEEELRALIRTEPLDAESRLREPTAASVFDARFPDELAQAARLRRHRGSPRDKYGGPVEGAFIVNNSTGKILTGGSRIFRGTRLMEAADLAAMLGRGVVFTRSRRGIVTAFLAVEVRQGRALRVDKVGDSELLDSSEEEDQQLPELEAIPSGPPPSSCMFPGADEATVAAASAAATAAASAMGDEVEAAAAAAAAAAAVMLAREDSFRPSSSEQPGITSSIPVSMSIRKGPSSRADGWDAQGPGRQVMSPSVAAAELGRLASSGDGCRAGELLAEGAGLSPDDLLAACRGLDGEHAEALCAPSVLDTLVEGALKSGKGHAVSKLLVVLWDKAQPLVQASAGGAGTTAYATTLCNVGSAQLRLGGAAAACPLLESALQVREVALGQDHTDVVSILELLGEAYMLLGNLAVAKTMWDRTLLIRVAQSGQEHISTASALQGLGSTYLRMGNPAGAQPFLQRVVHIRERQMGSTENAMKLAESLETLGSVYLELGNPAAAAPLLERALQTRQEHSSL